MLRIWLALTVLLEHASSPWRPMPGALAVQAFYILSGFYMQLVVRERYFRAGFSPSAAGRFYASRALRLYPAYLLALLGALACLQLGITPRVPLAAHQHEIAQGGLLAQACYWISNLTIAGLDAMRFAAFDTQTHEWVWKYDHLRLQTAPLQWIALDPGASADRYLIGTSLPLVPQAWSLAVEMAFYLLAPFLLLRGTPAVACVAAMSVALRLWLASQGKSDYDWLNGFFPSELATFLAGALACRVWQRHLQHAHARHAGEFCFTLVLGYFIAYEHLPGPALGSGKYWLFLALIACALPFCFAATRHHRLDRFIGELSYPVYIFHFVAIDLVRNVLPAGSPAAVAATAALTFLLALLVVRWVDAPLQAFRHRLLAKKDAPAPRPVLET
jgi:peptidoglycan/LPS O-acetylase OafA/YrhL